MKVKWLSRVWLFATPWTAAYEAPPSMGFSKQEYWSGLPLPSPYHWMNYWMFYRMVWSDIIKRNIYFLFHTNSLSFVTQGLEIKNKKTEILSQKLLFLFCKGKDVYLFVLSTNIYWLPPRGHYCPRSKTDTPPALAELTYTWRGVTGSSKYINK